MSGKEQSVRLSHSDMIFVSDYGDGQVWLNVAAGRGNCAVVMTHADTVALIAALQLQLVAEEVAA